MPLAAPGPDVDALAALHRRGDPLVLPNAWDVASALLLARAGFPAVGTTSLGVTAAAGLPDGSGEGRALTVALARAVAAAVDVPVTVDLEGGYADEPEAVAALVAELAGLGVAGVNLEDGRPDGTLRSTDHHAEVVAAAAETGVFVNARTDTHWLSVGAPDDRVAAAVERLRAYRRAGAGCVFLPGLTDLDGIAFVARSVDAPLNVLWHPAADVRALAEAGVARVSTGSGLYRHALSAAVRQARRARGDDVPPDAPGRAAGADVTYADLQALLAGGGGARRR